ncbi:TMEM86A [Cordylochernes scorpioides]|uniref:lysoplasmalogenase n=1 Tax=Cordylochernes scorpioides TaxID=51811 RepID=A0ABY6LFB4_9ARAC|nr:TMEM86A [Cordylochernes scorpioides]
MCSQPLGKCFDHRNLMTDRTKRIEVQLKSVGPKLVPFFKTVAIYFVLALPRDKPSCLSGLIKCLPILWLCIFVLLHGMSLADKHTYSRRILLGLAWSALGDFLLIWPWGFIWGMLAFAIAHVFYIWAFGMKPLNHAVGGVCLVATLLINYLLYPGYQGRLLAG